MSPVGVLEAQKWHRSQRGYDHCTGHKEQCLFCSEVLTFIKMAASFPMAVSSAYSHEAGINVAVGKDVAAVKIQNGQKGRVMP